MRLFTGLLLLAVFLSGCAIRASTSPSSPNTVLPVGSTVALEQAIEIPSGTVSLWIQKGKVVGNRRDVYRPACKFEMWTKATEDRTVQPDRFRVTRVVRDWMASANDTPFRRVSTAEGGPSVFEMETDIYLKSERQPDVYRLTCEQWEIPPNPVHVTIDQMNETLRGIMRIELPPHK